MYKISITKTFYIFSLCWINQHLHLTFFNCTYYQIDILIEYKFYNLVINHLDHNKNFRILKKYLNIVVLKDL